MRKQAWSPPGPGTSISKAPVNIDRLVMMYYSLGHLSVILWEQTAEAETLHQRIFRSGISPLQAVADKLHTTAVTECCIYCCKLSVF